MGVGVGVGMGVGVGIGRADAPPASGKGKSVETNSLSLGPPYTQVAGVTCYPLGGRASSPPHSVYSSGEYLLLYPFPDVAIGLYHPLSSLCSQESFQNTPRGHQ